jgi:steroid delta-isomerase-like uncharacterized protein
MTAYIEALRADADFGRYFADDVLWTTMESGDQMRGRQAVVDAIRTLHGGVFDARLEVRTLVAAEGTGLLEADFVGTHIGEFAGVPATGASVRLPYAVVYDIADGEITAVRAYLSFTALVGQLQAASAGAASA